MYYEKEHYMDVLKNTTSSYISFDCYWPCKFLATLADAGYDEFLKITSEDLQERVKGGSTSDACTGDIYIPKRDCYGRISIHKYTSDKFGIDVEIRPGNFSRVEEHNEENTFMSAVARMGS